MAVKHAPRKWSPSRHRFGTRRPKLWSVEVGGCVLQVIIRSSEPNPCARRAARTNACFIAVGTCLDECAAFGIHLSLSKHPVRCHISVMQTHDTPYTSIASVIRGLSMDWNLVSSSARPETDDDLSLQRCTFHDTAAPNVPAWKRCITRAVLLYPSHSAPFANDDPHQSTLRRPHSSPTYCLVGCRVAVALPAPFFRGLSWRCSPLLCCHLTDSFSKPSASLCEPSAPFHLERAGKPFLMPLVGLFMGNLTFRLADNLTSHYSTINHCE